MNEASVRKVERRTRQRNANRSAILDAARRVAERQGANDVSLRAVAAEAGYAPASVYEYFDNRAELVLALAAEEFSQLAKTLRDSGAKGMAPSARAALDFLKSQAALSDVVAMLESGHAPPEAERLFNGKLIGAMTAFAEAAGRTPLRDKGEQADVVLAAAAITGLAILARAGRLKTLGFDEQTLIERLDRRFAAALG